MSGYASGYITGIEWLSSQLYNRKLDGYSRSYMTGKQVDILTAI